MTSPAAAGSPTLSLAGGAPVRGSPGSENPLEGGFMSSEVAWAPLGSSVQRTAPATGDGCGLGSLGRPRGPGTAAAWACHSGLQGPSDGLAGPVLQVTRAGWGRVVAFLWPPKHLPPPATPRVPVGGGQGGGVRPGSRPPFPGCWQSALPRGQRARPGPAHGPACPRPVTATPARSRAAPGTDPQPGSVRAAGAAHADHRARGRATGGTRTGGFPERPSGAWPTGRHRVSLTVRHRGAREV